jgi:glycosyltransferase involved in cell wall biosynthesis
VTASANEPAASIVIPAHNEAGVIGRLLESLPREIDGRPLEIVVGCNGCTDDTAKVARRFGAKVVEIATPSKIAALNAADEVTVAFPRLYVDADVVLTKKAVLDVIRTLSEGKVSYATLPCHLDLEGRPWTVRAYFDVWLRVMKLRVVDVGSGIYALSREGRARFGRFPNVIADDSFVRNLYTPTERLIVPTDPTIVEAPRTFRAVVRRRVRVVIGNMELAARRNRQSATASDEAVVPWWRAVVTRPTLIPAAAVYAIANTTAHFAARRQLASRRSIDWGRDDTTRPPAIQ